MYMIKRSIHKPFCDGLLPASHHHIYKARQSLATKARIGRQLSLLGNSSSRHCSTRN
ncbi:protein of unknown function [Candidatus Methylocalor cossyra]|uniref:Uncharacterized protein n=1 Tax=Candidatus Methylocalor cossyra TaxID=3108543 RepID=A0ABM9NKP1_9GAMM